MTSLRPLACLAVMATAAALWTSPTGAQDCVGDCDGDQRVEISELILGVDIVIGMRPPSACAALEHSGGGVDVTQLVTAVTNALMGCVPAATPAATMSATAPPTSTASPTAAATPTSVSPAAACAALNGATIGGPVIGSATFVAATGSHPELCKVDGTIAPQLNFEVRLPTPWNGRALFLGGSGLDGFIPIPETILFNPGFANDGYATIATDSGHQGSFSDGSWALNDPQAVANFAYLATHTVLATARAIVAARYGRAADRTYFIGASQGGREGLIEAQRWPDDFDGIVAMEPVYDLTALALAENGVAQHVFAVAGGRLSSGKVDTLAHAVLDACDGLDGIADGIISNVAACHFDPAVLRCTGADSDACLTDPQIDTANAVHDGLTLDFSLAHDVRGYPGWPTGHEDSPTGAGGWVYWVVGRSADPSTSVGFSLSDQILRFFVARDAALDTLHFAPDAHAAALMAFSALVDATDPDLSAFAARGGKLIVWHGLADYAVSARSTALYYSRVVSTLGGQDAADRSLRFYTSPGVGHLNDGPGAGTTDFLRALIGWVETGAAPGDLVSTKANQPAGAPALSRPLCRYPTYPRYDAGDPNDASSFHCAAP